VIDPFLKALIVAENLENRVDSGEIQAPEDGRKESCDDGDEQPAAIRQGMTQGTEKVLHILLWVTTRGHRAVGPGLRSAVVAKSRRWNKAGSDGCGAANLAATEKPSRRY